MTLFKSKKGKRIRITKIDNKELKTQGIRLGIYEGAIFTMSERLPGGPVILKNMMQEIAIGKGFAEKIDVEECE